MADSLSLSKAFKAAIAENLNVRSTSQAIDSLLNTSRKTIDYEPPYQRNYVWKDDKASFFIESILLGVEIPPIILFIHAHDKKRLEVVDGRQRYETIKRFKEGKFKLNAKGLLKLKGLKGKEYLDLDDKFRRAFNNTTLRIIEFSTKTSDKNAELQKKLEDKIKKEIFRRYNSGITPLKTLDVKKAQHQGDNFTALMQKSCADNPPWLINFKRQFFKKEISKIDDTEVQDKIRQLLVLEHFPINIYASSNGRTELINQLFNTYIEVEKDNSEEGVNYQQHVLFDKFIQKIGFLQNLYLTINIQEWILYQGVYWALVILENNDIELATFFNEQLTSDLSNEITNNIALFTGDKRGFSSSTNQRFKLLADFFTSELEKKSLPCVEFKDYLNRSLKRSSPDTGTDEKFVEKRLVRPDAETTSVEDLISKMYQHTYLLRPAYQRQEVINNKKASGIIESMLLGIPLPTIFIFRREDGTSEVVDGQQRLLSILGFIGSAKAVLVKGDIPTLIKTKKENWPLAKTLPILTNCGRQSFSQLSTEDQDKIWDFELSIVYIDEESNPNFDPIDLFIRLNNKPYPIKDPSFEMWNSDAEPVIIQRVKDLSKENRGWFYYLKDDKRMLLEELLLCCAYLAYLNKQAAGDDYNAMHIYQAGDNAITFRLEKAKIDIWLDKAAEEDDASLLERQAILVSINVVNAFIEKISCLLGHNLSDGDKATKFDQLISLKTRARNQRDFYILWFLLKNIDLQTIESNKEKLSSAIMDFLSNNKQVPRENRAEKRAEKRVKVKTIFKAHLKKFWNEYS